MTIFVTREVIRQRFSLVTSSLVKIFAEAPHSWQKVVIHGNPHIILYILLKLVKLYVKNYNSKNGIYANNGLAFWYVAPHPSHPSNDKQ